MIFSFSLKFLSDLCRSRVGEGSLPSDRPLFKRKNFFELFLLFVAVMATGGFVFPVEPTPSELEGTGIEAAIGEKIDLDWTFIDQEGREVRLDDYFDGKTPVMLNLVYYTCPRLCGFALDGLSKGLSGLTLEPGKRFRVISLSIDVKDRSERARLYWDKYVKLAGKDGRYRDHWQFLVSPDNRVKDLADRIGFRYRYDEKLKEYIHSTALFVFTGDGVLARSLNGIQYHPLDLKLSVLETSKRRFQSSVERALLYCFTYDPSANSYVLHAVNLMRVGGIFTVVLVLTLIIILRQRERVKVH